MVHTKKYLLERVNEGPIYKGLGKAQGNKPIGEGGTLSY